MVRYLLLDSRSLTGCDGLFGKALGFSAEGREFESQPSQTNDSSQPGLGLGISRIGLVGLVGSVSE